MAIPQSFIQELIARADVVEIVGRHVQLKKAGANFMGLCPFHGEKSPSFSVSPTKQFYHCFGCGVSGDALKFLTEYSGLSFVEAVHDLAGQYGLQVPEDDASPAERARAAAQREKHSTLSEVLEKAGESWRRHLKASPRAIDYLKRRGLSGEIAREFGLGYAPEGWNALASVFPDYSDPLLAESGLVIVNTEDGQLDAGEARRYDRFRDRVMFPIRNVKGECIGFGGRVLGDEKPKYLNSPETPVFSKGRELYGLFEARAALREHGYALVTEGYMDVVALAQLGFPNAVATLGTACTPEHVQKLFRFTDAVVFSFDGDAAGRRAARKALDGALPFASDVRSVKFLFLPPEHDPDSFIREHGAPAFQRFVSEATPLSRFVLEVAREGCDLGSAEGRARMASNARPLWSALPQGALRRQVLGEIAALVQLDARELEALWAPAAAPQAAAGRYQNNSTLRTADVLYSRKSSASPARPRGRVLPLSRADHAARLLLANMPAWDALPHEMHALLCELPGDHGALFVWLDSQLHEHGVQPWAALREGLRGLPFEPLAERLMTAADGAPVGYGNEAPAAETEAELHNVLDRLLVDQLKAREIEAIDAAGSDPHALARWRLLQERRRSIEIRLKPDNPA